MLPAVRKLAESVAFLSGAFQVLQNKGLITNEEIKKAIEETLTRVPGNRTSVGKSDSGVPNPEGPGAVDGSKASASVEQPITTPT